VELITADWIHDGRSFAPDRALLVDDAGRIKAAGGADEVGSLPDAVGATWRHFADRAVAPGTVSAHSHSFQVFLRGPGDHPSGFRDWVKRVLYPLVGRLDADSLEAAALLCFSQMARAGVTSVGEFHYLHNDVDYAPQSRELADIVIGAARRVGIRIAFIRTIYDVQEVIGQGRFAEDYPAALDRIRELEAKHEDDPHVTVLPAAHSLHGATRDAVIAGAELARELDSRWHIHLAEQKTDVAYAQHLHGGSPLHVLDGWGLLDERAVVVHGIWLNAAERELMAKRGVGLVSNPTTNMALGDGIANLTDLLAQDVRVGLGTDMNATTNVFLEMRTAEMLQRVSSLKMGRLATAHGGAPDPARIFAMGTSAGADLIGVEAGALDAGRWADFVVVDVADPSLLPAAVQGGDALLSAMTTSMVAEAAVRDVYVAGRPIVEDGRTTGIEHAELVERVRGAKALLGDA